MATHVYPAHGWLPQGAHVQWQRDDQGKDFVTDWGGIIQAPGDGFCTRIGSDRPFPNGFGPRYAYVRITSGAFAGHEWYIGHCTALVNQGEHFGFGHPLARADQGHPSSIGVSAPFNGGWVELGEAFGSSPGAMASWHWYTSLLEQPLVISTRDPYLRYGSWGWRVLGMTAALTRCGWCTRPTWRFHRAVHGAVVAFQRYHHLVPDGIVGPITNHAIQVSAAWCKAHHRKEKL